MIAVKSSNVESVSYNPGKAVLTCKFRNGSTYDYANVSAPQYASFLKAKSKGGWIANELVRKPRTHPNSKHL